MSAKDALTEVGSSNPNSSALGAITSDKDVLYLLCDYAEKVFFCKGKRWRKGKQTSGTFLLMDKLAGICFSLSVQLLSLACKIALKPPCWSTFFEDFIFFCNTVRDVSGFEPSFAEIFRLDVSRVLLAALIGSVLSPSLRVFFAVGIGVMFLVTAMLHGVDVVVC